MSTTGWIWQSLSFENGLVDCQRRRSETLVNEYLTQPIQTALNNMLRSRDQGLNHYQPAPGENDADGCSAVRSCVGEVLAAVDVTTVELRQTLAPCRNLPGNGGGSPSTARSSRSYWAALDTRDGATHVLGACAGSGVRGCRDRVAMGQGGVSQQATATTLG